MLQRAEDLLKVKNLEVAFQSKSGNSFALLSNNCLFEMANQVDLNLGKNTSIADDNITIMKSEEVAKNDRFDDSNPEIDLPVSLDVVINNEEFPPLFNGLASKTPPLKDDGLVAGEKSWARIVGQGNFISTVNNDRCFLEC